MTLKKIILAVILAFTFSVAFSQSFNFNTSSIVPAAEAKVIIRKDDFNYKISVTVKYLADADRLQPAKKMYVVWLVSEQSYTINLGVIESSVKSSSSLNTITAFKPKSIFITAEDQNDILRPAGVTILETSDFSIK